MESQLPAQCSQLNALRLNALKPQCSQAQCSQAQCSQAQCSQLNALKPQCSQLNALRLNALSSMLSAQCSQLNALSSMLSHQKNNTEVSKHCNSLEKIRVCDHSNSVITHRVRGRRRKILPSKLNIRKFHY